MAHKLFESIVMGYHFI